MEFFSFFQYLNCPEYFLRIKKVNEREREWVNAKLYPILIDTILSKRPLDHSFGPSANQKINFHHFWLTSGSILIFFSYIFFLLLIQFFILLEGKKGKRKNNFPVPESNFRVYPDRVTLIFGASLFGFGCGGQDGILENNLQMLQAIFIITLLYECQMLLAGIISPKFSPILFHKFFLAHSVQPSIFS